MLSNEEKLRILEEKLLTAERKEFIEKVNQRMDNNEIKKEIDKLKPIVVAELLAKQEAEALIE